MAISEVVDIAFVAVCDGCQYRSPKHPGPVTKLIDELTKEGWTHSVSYQPNKVAVETWLCSGCGSKKEPEKKSESSQDPEPSPKSESKSFRYWGEDFVPMTAQSSNNGYELIRFL